MKSAIAVLNDAIEVAQQNQVIFEKDGRAELAQAARETVTEYKRAIAILQVADEQDMSVSPSSVVAAAMERTSKCQALINVRDTDDGKLDMDVTFIPEVNNNSMAHRLVQSFVEYANKPLVA